MDNSKKPEPTTAVQPPINRIPAQIIHLDINNKRSKLFESDAQRFLRNRAEAHGYHRRAALFARDGMRASVVFNVAAVAIECYMIALCAFHRSMASNHSFSCLVSNAEALMDFPADLALGIRDLDKIFGICSIDDYHHGSPQASDAQHAVNLCDALHDLLASLGELDEEHERG